MFYLCLSICLSFHPSLCLPVYVSIFIIIKMILILILIIIIIIIITSRWRRKKRRIFYVVPYSIWHIKNRFVLDHIPQICSYINTPVYRYKKVNLNKWVLRILHTGHLTWLGNLFHRLGGDARKGSSTYIADWLLGSSKVNKIQIAAVSLVYTFRSDRFDTVSLRIFNVRY